MVLIDSVKYACATCIKGHRSSTCNHDTRPLIEIKKKGRPVTQCLHCRELRKTKQVHVKCVCEGRPDHSTTPRTVVLPAGTLSKTNGLVSSVSLPVTPVNESSCDCKTRGGSCDCCTPKHAPRHPGGEGSGKPAITRGHTYHASTSSMTMSSDLVSHHPKFGASLQRASSLHGSSGSSSPNNNNSGSHHPTHQHFNHGQRHFQPYSLSHPHQQHHHSSNTHHAHFDLPDVKDEEEEFKPVLNTPNSPNSAYRRHRSSSASYGELARPFPPVAQAQNPIYLNSAGAISLPDVLGGWTPSSSDVYNASPSSDVNSYGGGISGERSSSFPSAPASTVGLSDFEAFMPDDIFAPRAVSATATTFAESTQIAGNSSASEYTGGIPEFNFPSSMNVGLTEEPGTFDMSGMPPMQEPNEFRYSSGMEDIESNNGGGLSEYDAMLASFLSLPQQPTNMQAIASSGSGSTGASSRPPSMTGSTSRSSSRASGGRPTGFDFSLDMTPASSSEAARGRPTQRFVPNSFPVADPFESAGASTGIPTFESFQLPSQSQQQQQPQQMQSFSSSLPPPHSRISGVLEMETMRQSQSLSPMSQDAQDDGNGTAFPAWPQSGPFDGTSPVPSGYESAPAFDYTPSTTMYDVVAKNGRALSVGSAHRQLQQGLAQKRASLEYDDSAWDAQSTVA